MEKGFTLLELLIVVVILGVLATIGIVQYKGVVESARSAEAYAVLSDIVNSERAFYIENDSYTTTITDLNRFDVDPSDNSDNFTFSIGSAAAVEGYAQALRVSEGNGRMSYGMCLKSSKKAVCDDSTDCNPGCS